MVWFVGFGCGENGMAGRVGLGKVSSGGVDLGSRGMLNAEGLGMACCGWPG